MNQIRFLAGATSLVAFSAAMAAGGDVVHRPARLFVAGNYPDKGCAVTEADLDTIVARFNEDGNSVPVKAEHVDSPLDPLGEVVSLYRRGPELFGMLCFSAGVNAHVESRGVQDLSIALVRESDADGGGYRLTEASLVFRGRVPGAGFLTAEQISEKVAAFTAAGRLTPAMAPFAARLLSVQQPVTFSDGSTIDVVKETIALLFAAPLVQPRSLAAPAVFSTAKTPAISETTRTMARGLGLAPDRLHDQLKKGVAA